MSDDKLAALDLFLRQLLVSNETFKTELVGWSLTYMTNSDNYVSMRVISSPSSTPMPEQS